MIMDLEEQYDNIYRYCYYRLHHVQLAEDITQEVFLRYFEHMQEGGDARPLAYLYAIARNLCIDEYRKKKGDGVFEELPGEHPQEGVVETVVLKQALETLTERERELILLRYVNEVPMADLARVYQISRFALYRELKKALKQMERRLSGEKGIEG